MAGIRSSGPNTNWVAMAHARESLRGGVARPADGGHGEPAERRVEAIVRKRWPETMGTAAHGLRRQGRDVTRVRDEIRPPTVMTDETQTLV
jgi:hypothetical protein